MEFVKLGKKKYLMKNSNGRIVDEKTKLELENNDLVLKDITGCNCQKETTKKIAKNKKRIKEIEREEIFTNVRFSKERVEPKAIVKLVKETALQDKENADDIIKETDKSI